MPTRPGRNALLLAFLLAGCGQTAATVHRPPALAALVGGKAVRVTDLDRYVQYATSFFGWAGHAVPRTGCRAARVAPACATLRSQVLGRLIEEQAVLDFAARSGIRLNADDRARIDDEMIRLEGDRSTTTSFFATVHAPPDLIRATLERQLLVQQVEAYVTPAGLLQGFSFRVEKLRPPASTAPSESYRLALRLAHGGQTPSGTRVSTEWVAAFRLSAAEQASLLRAHPGQTVGPVRAGSSWLALRLLSRGSHAYGRPARAIVETSHFRYWLKRYLGTLAVRCFGPNGQRIACPVY